MPTQSRPRPETLAHLAQRLPIARLLHPDEVVSARRQLESGGKCSWADYEDYCPIWADSRPTTAAAEGEHRSEAAQRCAGCAVIDLCLQVALSTGEQTGIWGGHCGWQLRELRAAIVYRNSKRPHQRESEPEEHGAA